MIANKMSKWPTPEDYDDVLLKHNTALYDAKLKTKQVLLDHFGQPLRLNGGGSSYVCVYRLDDWVIRCFAADPSKNITPPSNIEERYQGIIAYQRHIGNSLSFLVPNEWMEQGIKVIGSDFPLLKLQYIANSQTLGEFLADHYAESSLIGFLTKEWLKVIQQFEEKHVAHGDLDLSNVLIYGTYPSLKLRLIDFDGMYVPNFAEKGMQPSDRGHEHFQPVKTGIRQFNDEMDRFSALIIYLSLCALEMDPSLWEQCKASERRLLLGKPDFERLQQSENFARLRQKSHNDHLKKCLNELEDSITKGFMPRSLRDILGIYTSPVTLHDVPILHLALPLDEGRDINGVTSSEPPSSPWLYTPAPPPQPLSVPLPDLEPEPTGATIPATPQRRASSSRGWVIALIVILVIALIIFFIVHASTSSSAPQSSPSEIAIQMALSVPFIDMTHQLRKNTIQERQLDDEA